MNKPDPLDRAFDRLDALLPDKPGAVLRWLRSERSRPVRIPLGILCIILGFLWFLPVIGLEFLPIGLLLIAQDVPVLRRPAGHLTNWMIDRFENLRAGWRRWRARRRREAQSEAGRPQPHRNLTPSRGRALVRPADPKVRPSADRGSP